MIEMRNFIGELFILIAERSARNVPHDPFTIGRGKDNLAIFDLLVMIEIEESK